MEENALKLGSTGQRLKSAATKYFSFIGLALVVLIFEILTRGDLLSSRNLMNIFNNFFSIGLGAMGVVFLMSLGELDLSVGAIVGLAAAFAACASKTSLALIFPVALATGLGVGLLNGFVISKLRVESFIGTLAMSFVVRGVTVWLLNGSAGIPVSQRVFDQDGVKIAVFVLALAILYTLFEFTPFGKRCRSIGASADAARQAGVRVERTKLIAFAISGLMCGLAGFFSLVRTCTASSKTGSAFEFDVLLAVLFGGISLTGGWPVKFRSAVIGSVAMAVMKNGMSIMGINGLTQQVVEGVILIVIVVISFDRKSVGVVK